MLKILFSRSYRDDIEKYNVVENPPLAFDIRHTSEDIINPLSMEMRYTESKNLEDMVV